MSGPYDDYLCPFCCADLNDCLSEPCGERSQETQQ